MILPDKLRKLAPVGTLAVLAGLLCFAGVSGPLQEPQESRYAEIPRQMLAEGRWAVPVLHGQPYYDKPPLLYWLVMGSYALFGVHDWAARLVACVAAFGTILVAYRWGRQTLGVRAGLAGAAVLCLSARFVYLARMLTMDTILCLWVVIAWTTAHLAVGGSRFRWLPWLVSAAASGLGLLTKGPVTLVLVGLPILAHDLIERRTLRPRLLAWTLYLIIALGVALPWYLAAAASDPEFVGYFFWKHNVQRYLEPFDHEEPFWFYLPGLLLGLLPWTLLLPGLVRSRSRPPAVRLFLLASLWCLLFYSVAGCKRPGYILPALPPLALALGWYLNERLETDRSDMATLGYRATQLVLALAVAVGLVAVFARLQTAAVGLSFAGVAALAVGLTISYGRRWSARASWLVCGGVTFVGLLLGLHGVLPAYADKFSLRAQIERQADPRVPVVCYPHRWDAISFYLRRDDVRVYASAQRERLLHDLQDRDRDETLVFVKTGRSVTELLRDLPASLEFVPQSRGEIVTVGVVRGRRP